MDKNARWRRAIASGGKPPSWRFLKLIISEWEELAPSAIPFSDFAIVIAQAYRLAECFPIADERRLPAEEEKEPEMQFFVAMGYAHPTAMWLYRGNLLVRWITFIATLLDEAQSWNKRRGTLPPSFPASEKRAREEMPAFCKFHSHNPDNPEAVYFFLRQLLTPLRIAASAFSLQLLTDRAAKNIDGINARDILIESTKCCFDLTQVPNGLSLITSRSRERLKQFIDSVASRYAIEVKASMKEGLSLDEDQTRVILDPESVVAVALITLLLEACDMIDDGRSESPLLESKAEEYQQLLASARPAGEQVKECDFSGLKDFVVPPGNLDDWPGSIPEVEELVTYCVLSNLAGNQLETDPHMALARSMDGGALALRIPSPVCAPVTIGFPTDELRRLVRTHTLITWALLPSSRRVGGQPAGFFSASGYAYFFERIRIQLESAEDQRQTRKRLERLIDVGAKGGAAAAGHFFIEAFFPGIPAAATAALGAVAEHLLIRTARRVLTIEK